MFKVYRNISCFLVFSCYSFNSYSIIDAYITSAARTEQSELTTPASITVITREEIESSGVRHIVDLLHGRGGVQVNDTYGDGSRSSIGMRGFGETANANTLILVDGRRLNNMDIAAPDLNSIALYDIERIEIVQGSAGVLFGDQAVGGVINIITRRTEKQVSSFKLSKGSYNTSEFYGMHSQIFEDGINYRLSLNLRESDNYRDHNEASYLNGFGEVGYAYEDGRVFFELQYIDDELNVPGALFYDDVISNRKQVLPAFAGDFSDAETLVGRFGFEQKISSNWSFEGELTGRDTDGVFRLSSYPTPETEDATQTRKVAEFTPRIIGRLPGLNGVLLTLGVDVTTSRYNLQSRFGDQFNNQDQHSIYTQAVVSATDSTDITVGARRSMVRNDLSDAGPFALYPIGSEIDDQVTVGTMGLAIKFDEGWRALFRLDQNYRFAKVDEYLLPAFTPMFTPVLLKTQEGLSVEAGLEWVQNNNSAKLLFYKLGLDNEIAFDPANGANINLEKTDRKGLITDGRAQVSDRLGISFSYTLTRGEVVEGAFAGKRIPLLAEHSGMISANYKLSDFWQIYGEVQAIDDRIFSGDFDNNLSSIPGYGVSNLKVEYSLQNFELSFRVNNLFDKQYSRYGTQTYNPFPVEVESYYPSPERNFMLSASWNIK